MKRIPFNDLWRGGLRSQWGDCLREIKGVLRDAWFLHGSRVEQFEAAFAKRVGAKHCVAVSSGTDAIALALRAFGLARDTVWMPAFGCPATVAGIRLVGGRESFVDVDPDTGLAGAAQFDCVNDEVAPPQAIVPVHLFGQRIPDMAALREWADHWGVIVIEDAAQAAGVAGIGQHSHAATWSFYPTKNLGALGDAGAITTNDDGIAERARSLRHYGAEPGWQIGTFGWVARMDEVQAAALNVKLRRFDRAQQERQRIAALYRQMLPAHVLPRLATPTNWHLFPIRVPNREGFRAALESAGIQTAIHYPLALPDLAACGGHAHAYAHARAWAREEVSLPLFPGLTDGEVERVAAVVRENVVDRVSAAP